MILNSVFSITAASCYFRVYSGSGSLNRPLFGYRTSSKAALISASSNYISIDSIGLTASSSNPPSSQPGTSIRFAGDARPLHNLTTIRSFSGSGTCTSLHGRWPGLRLLSLYHGSVRVAHAAKHVLSTAPENRQKNACW